MVRVPTSQKILENQTAAIVGTPLGAFSVSVTELGLSASAWIADTGSHLTVETESGGLLEIACAQIAGWFRGERRIFDLPFAPASSGFQTRLRAALVSIPFVATVTYGPLAQELGTLPQTIGQGCKRNPLPLLVPMPPSRCARSDRRLFGRAGDMHQGEPVDLRTYPLGAVDCDSRKRHFDRMTIKGLLNLDEP